MNLWTWFDLGFVVFTVPNGGVEIFSQGKTRKQDNRCDGFEIKEVNHPESRPRGGFGKDRHRGDQSDPPTDHKKREQ